MKGVGCTGVCSDQVWQQCKYLCIKHVFAGDIPRIRATHRDCVSALRSGQIHCLNTQLQVSEKCQRYSPCGNRSHLPISWSQKSWGPQCCPAPQYHHCTYCPPTSYTPPVMRWMAGLTLDWIEKCSLYSSCTTTWAMFWLNIFFLFMRIFLSFWRTWEKNNWLWLSHLKNWLISKRLCFGSSWWNKLSLILLSVTLTHEHIVKKTKILDSWYKRHMNKSSQAWQLLAHIWLQKKKSLILPVLSLKDRG